MSATPTISSGLIIKPARRLTSSILRTPSRISCIDTPIIAVPPAINLVTIGRTAAEERPRKSNSGAARTSTRPIPPKNWIKLTTKIAIRIIGSDFRTISTASCPPAINRVTVLVSRSLLTSRYPSPESGSNDLVNR